VDNELRIKIQKEPGEGKGSMEEMGDGEGRKQKDAEKFHHAERGFQGDCTLVATC
jgi:hypothetical protein